MEMLIVNKVRVGIIGLSAIGTPHCRNFFEGKIFNGVLAAVCDVNQDRLKWAKEEFGDGIGTFTSDEEMMKSGLIDAVVVATPHYFHPELVIKSLNNNLHVLSEKPAGVYAKQVREMNEVANKSDKIFSMMFNLRTNPSFYKVRELVKNGAIGDFQRVSWTLTNWFRTQAYFDSAKWRGTWKGEGGGLTVNQYSHQIDLLQWICGMPKRTMAFCYEGKYHDIEVEDEVTAYFEFPNGATGVFIASTGESPGTNRLEIAGNKGKLVLEDNKIDLWQIDVKSSEFIKSAEGSFDEPKVCKTEVVIDDEYTSYVGVLNNWCDCIAKGTPLIAKGTEGIDEVQLSNGILLSSWLGEWVEIPANEDLFFEKLQEKIKKSTFIKKEGKNIVHDLKGSIK